MSTRRSSSTSSSSSGKRAVERTSMRGHLYQSRIFSFLGGAKSSGSKENTSSRDEPKSSCESGTKKSPTTSMMTSSSSSARCPHASKSSIVSLQQHGMKRKQTSDSSSHGSGNHKKHNKNNNMIRTIYCDLDGVLVDFDRGVVDVSGGKRPDELSSQQLWGGIVHKIPHFYRTLPWMKDGPELWRTLCNIVAQRANANINSNGVGIMKLKILTGISGGGTVAQDKFDWCQKELAACASTSSLTTTHQNSTTDGNDSGIVVVPDIKKRPGRYDDSEGDDTDDDDDENRNYRQGKKEKCHHHHHHPNPENFTFRHVPMAGKKRTHEFVAPMTSSTSKATFFNNNNNKFSNGCRHLRDDDKNITIQVDVITCWSKNKHMESRRGHILIDDREKLRQDWERAGGIFILHTSTKSTIQQLRGHGLL